MLMDISRIAAARISGRQLHCTSPSSPGRRVSRRLRLEALKVRRGILAGIAGNICVLFTANDAYMREFRIFAPADCIVSNTPEENAYALGQNARFRKRT